MFANAPSLRLPDGRAEVLDFLRLGHNLGEPYAPTCDESHARPDEGS